MRQTVQKIFYSFPVQLLILHLRSNTLMLFVWLVLLFFVTGDLGLKFGFRYLFISPEYLHKTGFWSFFFIGIGYGVFVMSWNLTTYMLGAKNFPFLAALGRPFTNFCFNNFVLPAAFAGIYLYQLYHFQQDEAMAVKGVFLTHAAAFMLGNIVFISALAIYFQLTNKDILNYVNQDKLELLRIGSPSKRKDNLPDFEAIKKNENDWRVDTYLTESLQIRLVRSVAHYNRGVLMQVFRQNHLNALVVQLISLCILLSLGFMMDQPAFRIPTGTSIFLLCSVLIGLLGAITFWFGKWRLIVFLIGIFFINELSTFQGINDYNRAYGLDYSEPRSPYTVDHLDTLCSSNIVDQDKENTLKILEKWKEKNQSPSGKKPKMVFYCVSGGGLKATTWSMRILQHLDSLTNGEFMQHTTLMSGASGGMIGSAYYRELYRQQQEGKRIDLNDDKYIKKVSSDLLNAVSFAIATHDIFLPIATFEKNGFTYKKDRGYIFEKSLNENTDFVMDKPLRDYRRAELEAHIPLLFITPSITNDGRRLYVSSQPVSYMMISPIGVALPGSVGIDAVDLNLLLQNQDAGNLAFTSAIRMNATYPYILPNVALPSNPQVECLDAGFRDNYGLKSAIRFIDVFDEWIQENTSGIVVIVVRAFDREREIYSNENEGIIETLTDPLGIASKIMTLQDFEHDANLSFLYQRLGKDKFDIIRFIYEPSEELEESPISFFITNRQRQDILDAVYSEENRRNALRLKKILE